MTRILFHHGPYELRYLIVEQDINHLNRTFIGEGNDEALEKQLNDVIFNSEGEYKDNVSETDLDDFLLYDIQTIEAGIIQ